MTPPHHLAPTRALRPLIAGNWKMNGKKESLSQIDEILAQAARFQNRVDLMVCPPNTLISAFAEKSAGASLLIGAQDCHAETCGAHTGDVNAEMIADAGAQAVILGHSERRSDYFETDNVIKRKVLAAWEAGLTALVCVGETWRQKESGQAVKVILDQLTHCVPSAATSANTVIVYEPVWAIGTGRIPSGHDLGRVHGLIRSALAERFAAGNGIRILYGGSVNEKNAEEILRTPGVDGLLVGRASLEAEEFIAVAQACATLVGG